VRDRIGTRVVGLTAVLLAWVLLLSGCAGGLVDVPRPPPTPLKTAKPPVPRECVFEGCHGRIGDTSYVVTVPARWNGTLLLYVPGFERVFPTHAGRPLKPPPAPRPQLTRRFFDEGYAVAAATYAWGGWSVRQSLAAAEAVYEFVRAHVGAPQRVYTWGRSMGGLVSVLLAERHPDWVTGAASACGVLGGSTRFFDLALDVAYAVRTLLLPSLPLARYGSYLAAARAYGAARQAVIAASHGDAGRRVLLLLIADLVHAPRGEAAGPTASVPARVNAAVQTINSALSFTTFARWSLEADVGGVFSTNAEVDYASRVDAAEQAALDRLAPGAGGPGVGARAAGGRL
jgi:pimeloyl-ACP methyl ester carboxylesterase